MLVDTRTEFIFANNRVLHISVPSIHTVNHCFELQTTVNTISKKDWIMIDFGNALTESKSHVASVRNCADLNIFPHRYISALFCSLQNRMQLHLQVQNYPSIV